MALFKELIDLNGWLDIPDQVITREGYFVKTSTDIWHLPYPTLKSTKLDFNRILEPGIRWITKRYIQERLEVTSTVSGLVVYNSLLSEFFRFQTEFKITGEGNRDSVKEKLILLVENSLSNARMKHRLWMMSEPIRWYIWCAENYPEIGFCPAYALELSSLRIPGCPKGEAVRMSDPDRGPLHRSLEFPLLIKALLNDESQVFEHLQQKAALALSIAFGRNPANYVFLREGDLENLLPNSNNPCWLIHIPRIKKRQLHPRDDLLSQHLDSKLAKYLLDLIAANKLVDVQIETSEGIISLGEIDKPLFINRRGNKVAIRTGLIGEVFNITSSDFCSLLKDFVKRHNIISPVTGDLLQINSRRLRYTLGSNLAAEGISKKELARILDHSDTQHVQVYFELAGNIVEHLDKATAKGFVKYLNLFRGKIIEDISEAINSDREDKHLFFVDESKPTDQTQIGVCGKSSICYLDPPFSCYLCPKFQPYRHADHEYILDCLLREREVRMEKNKHLGIQLDDVIFAVTQVVEQCQGISYDG